MHPLDPRHERRLFLAGVGAGVLGIAGLGALTWAIGGDVRPLSLIGRPIVFAAVGALGLQGRRWPRVVLMLWSGCLALLTVVAAITILRAGHGRDGALFLLLAALFAGACLLFVRAGHEVAPLATPPA